MTSSGEIMEFDGAQWTLHAMNAPLEGMVQDAQGSVWAGKDKDGVAYISMWYGPVFKMVNDEPVFFAAADNIPRRVIGRPNGDIWINNYGTLGTCAITRRPVNCLPASTLTTVGLAITSSIGSCTTA